MSFQAAEALKRRAIMLEGQDDMMRRRGLKELMAAAGVGDGDLDLETVIADSRHPMEWTGAAGSVPFLSDYRIVVVRNLGRVSPAKVWDGQKIGKDHPFAQELSRLPDSSRLVLVMDDESGAKAEAASSSGQQWRKLVEAGGGKAYSFDPDPSKAADALMEAAKQNGKTLSRPLAQMLSEMVGGQLGVALGELEKLCFYVGSAGAITEADIRRLVSPDTDYNVFQLAESVTAGETGKALAQIQTLADRHPRLEEHVFPRVFPILSRQLRLLFQARICLDHGCHPSSPTEEVRALLPAKPNITGEKDWLQRKLMTAARRLTLPQLAACLRELEEADAKFKGQGAAYTPRETLEAMTLRLCAICSGSGVTRRS